VKILGLHRDFGGSDYYRIRLPLGELAQHGHETSCGPAKTNSKPEGADIVVGEMIGSRLEGPQVHKWWRRLAKDCKRVYELDDDPFEVEPHSPVYSYYTGELSKDSLTHCIQTADLVTASVEPLAERMRKINPNVVVVKNRIDEKLLDVVRPRRDKLVIGWAGGSTHEKDLEEATYGLRKILDRNRNTECHFIGADFRHLVKRPMRYTGWSHDLFDYYCKIDFDIGIAPLRATKFSEAKSAIKAMEYSALGIPVIASDVAPYRDFIVDGVTGWLVRREHEWAVRLRELVNDEAMREEMGQAAKSLAAEWTIQKGWTDWLCAYESIL
jgi:glycosyltransferase involved in cell wall biosynthesis